MNHKYFCTVWVLIFLSPALLSYKTYKPQITIQKKGNCLQVLNNQNKKIIYKNCGKLLISETAIISTISNTKNERECVLDYDFLASNVKRTLCTLLHFNGKNMCIKEQYEKHLGGITTPICFIWANLDAKNKVVKQYEDVEINDKSGYTINYYDITSAKNGDRLQLKHNNTIIFNEIISSKNNIVPIIIVKGKKYIKTIRLKENGLDAFTKEPEAIRQICIQSLK